MHNQEAIQMMQRSVIALRIKQERIDRLAPKAEAYDMINAILNLIGPRVPMGAEEDVAWLLERRIKELQKEEAEAKAKPISAEEFVNAAMGEAAERDPRRFTVLPLGDQLVGEYKDCVKSALKPQADEMVDERTAVTDFDPADPKAGL